MNKKTKKLVLSLLVVVVIGLCIFILSFGSNVKKVTIGNREMPTADGTTEELTKDFVIEQKFINTTENIKEVGVVFSRLYFLEEDDKDVPICIELSCDGKLLASTTVISDDVPDQHRVYLNIDNPISGYVGKEFILKIYETYSSDTGLSLMKSDNDKESYFFNNKKINGSICFSIIGE